MDWLCDVELDLDVIIENLDLDSYIHVEEENYYEKQSYLTAIVHTIQYVKQIQIERNDVYV